AGVSGRQKDLLYRWLRARNQLSMHLERKYTRPRKLVIQTTPRAKRFLSRRCIRPIFRFDGRWFSLPCSGDVRQSRPIKARSVSKPSPWMPASLNPLRSTGATAVTTTAIELDLQPFLDLKLRHLCNVCPSFFFFFF
ncbi:unnamed protein product, partial [Ixodes persulcatus]